VLALVLIAGVFLWQRTVFPLWMVDLFHIQYAAHEWQAGEPQWMYATNANIAAWEAHRAPIADRLGAEGVANPYYYPPFLAALLSPFSNVPAVVWRNVVFALNVVLLFVFAFLVGRLSSADLTTRSFLWSLALVLVCYPMARATKLGQIVPLLAALTWMGFLSLRSRRFGLHGALIGLVGATKMFPIGALFLAFLMRRTRAVAAGMAAFLGILAISILAMGIEIHRLWWQALTEFSSVVYCFFGNQSLTGWFSRAFLGQPMNAMQFAGSPMTTLVTLTGMVIFGGTTAAILIIRHRQIGDAIAPAAGLLMSGLLLSLPVVWDHYLLFVLPALGWAIHEVWTRGDSSFWEWWLVAAVFFFTMKLTHFYGDGPFGSILSGSQLFGLILFWIWLVRRVWNDNRQLALTGDVD
jgi:hypothetical protein